MNFHQFKTAIQKQFKQMETKTLFRVKVDKDVLWNTYLDSFPAGTNEIFRERRSVDCSCCRHFIRDVGDIVTIENGVITSIWDVSNKLNDGYQVVAKALSEYIHSQTIENKFLHFQAKVGIDKNYQQLPDGKTLTFEHFQLTLPSHATAKNKDIPTLLNDSNTTCGVFERSLQQISLEAINTVQELIAQNSLYRGQEATFAINSFKTLKVAYDKLETAQSKNLFIWEKFSTVPAAVAKIKNTAIGTLLEDLSEGKDLEISVKAYERIMAPTNYKRTTALITPAMKEKAKQELEAQGLMPSLERRYATLEDITVNNILYVDRTVKKTLKDVFDDLPTKTAASVKSLSKVEEVSIEDFVEKIIPTATSLEIMFENKHVNNLVSLIAPVNEDSPNMFKWQNKFSWNYNGDLTDSIKERVKQAGGQIDAYFRNSLAWFNYDDLDLHMKEPDGNEISFYNKGISNCGGRLDVDMNAGSGSSRNAVENIFYKDKSKMKEGIYKLIVNNYSKRESIDVGFEVEMEMDGVTRTFSYAKAVPSQANVTVAKIEYNKATGFKILESIAETKSSKKVWNIPTESFHKVNVAMLSPNYWDEKQVGNKHYFFMLEDCKSDTEARGFFNEFLKEDLSPYRKTLELVGAKMKIETSDKQLSGVGFSSTQKQSVIFKVNGAFSRTIKVNI